MEQNVKESRAAVPRRRPLHVEYKFGMDEQPPVVLRSGGRELQLRGKIDRVDVLTDPAVAGWRYLVDHKASGSGLDPVAQYDEGAILQLALYTRAIEQLEPGPGVWGAAYQIVKGGRMAALYPRGLTKKGITNTNKTQLEAAARIEAALEHALDHVEAIQQGIFPARIPNCSNSCPMYCDFGGICRERQSAREGA
jgi:ATP-dependent helicase/DNAse subunit B